MWERRSLTLDFRFLCLSAGGHFPSLIDYMIHKCNDIKLVKLIQINTKTKRPGSKVQTALTIACLSLSSHELCEEPKLICSPLPFSPQCPSSRLLTVLRGFHASLDTDTQTPCVWTLYPIPSSRLPVFRHMDKNSSLGHIWQDRCLLQEPERGNFQWWSDG